MARLALRGVDGVVLAGALVLVLCLSGALDVGRALDLQVSSFEFTDAGGLKVASWVRENTGPDAVFLTASDHNQPVTALAGRRVVCGYTGWLYTYGLDDYFAHQRDAYLMLSGQPVDCRTAQKIQPAAARATLMPVSVSELPPCAQDD